MRWRSTEIQFDRTRRPPACRTDASTGSPVDLVHHMTTDSKPTPKPPRPKRKDPQPEADDAIQRAIGEKLRAVFDSVVEQPVPDRFSALLRQLEEQERRKK